MSEAPAPPTALVVRTKIFPLAFLLLLFKTVVSIDRQAQRLPWGVHTFPVAPGTHQVEVGFDYLWMKGIGSNALSVEVPAGSTVTVEYRSPWLVFLKGKIHLAPA